MAYAQITLNNLTDQLSVLLDDLGEIYWVKAEKQLAIYEALLVFGALTNYWRGRGTFTITPAALAASPWIDLSVALPALRTRTWTLGTMTQEIQYMCLEAANGISGAGMSGQISVNSILQAIQRARNRFVLDTHLPLSVHSQSVTSGAGEISFPQASVFVHRASWMNSGDGAWSNLWREDAWSVDHGNYLWTSEPSTTPVEYSEAENSPLLIQLSPPPSANGTLEVLTVDSLQIDLTNPASTFGVPDEWVHAIKYAALSDLFSSESQNVDPLRAAYAENRYQQAVGFAKDARSIMRLLAAGSPLTIDSFASIDAGVLGWRNSTGAPFLAGVFYDWLAFVPGIPGTSVVISADVSQSAPLPSPTGFVQIGTEDLNNIIDYASHILTFKCGGNEFKGTFPNYDSFMSQVSGRKGINSAKIRYLEPLFGQPQREWAQRPDQMKVGG